MQQKNSCVVFFKARGLTQDNFDAVLLPVADKRNWLGTIAFLTVHDQLGNAFGNMIWVFNFDLVRVTTVLA